MTLAFIVIVFDLALLVWSADRFVERSASTARHFGMPLCGLVAGAGVGAAHGQLLHLVWGAELLPSDVGNTA